MFAPPPVVETEVFAVVPEELRREAQNVAWINAMRDGKHTNCFIEGPAFDRDGNLFVCDIPFGRILKFDRSGRASVVARYQGEPCGLAIDRNGLLHVADYRRGILRIDPATGDVVDIVDSFLREGFRGCNDLTFSSAGDLYFTDQGQTGLQDTTGRLFRLSSGGQLELLLSNIPSPNGLALNPEENTLYLAVTRANAIWRVPIRSDGHVPKVGNFIQLSGGLAGPDGLAVDSAGNLAIAHAGLGVVWLFSRFGEPIARIQSRVGMVVTNVAFGWPDQKVLYITESDSGTVLRAQLDVPGKTLLSHL
jgi:gluconolactonase